MKESMYVGDGPWDEPCPDMTEPDYAVKGRAHCARFIKQIRSHYGPEPGSGHLYVKANPHDFGTYYSVEYGYNDLDDEAVIYGFDVEADSKSVLERWNSSGC